MRRYEPSWFSAVPTIYQILVGRAGVDGDRPASPRLRFVRSASAPLPPALLDRVEERFGVPMLEAYGMTEASHQIASNPLPTAGQRVPGSVGVATGTEIAILDKRGRLLQAGTTGEVGIRGPNVTPGYRNDPEANAASFTDGWFHTGDRGVLDANGYLYLQGRLKEMIIRGGENISPYEIEEVLLGHPVVTEAVCFGAPDEKYGEEVAAAVVLSGAADAQELLDHCREQLAAFKVPKTIRIVEAIPRTATGKLQRSRIAARLLEGGP